MQEKYIYGPRATLLRCPNHEQQLAVFARSLGPTANICRDRITFAIQDWHDDGGVIATADGRVIDMERLESVGELVAHDVSGKPVLLEPAIPLCRVEDSVGLSSRRTYGRIFAKIGQSTDRRVNSKNLPRYFWIAVARAILEARALAA